MVYLVKTKFKLVQNCNESKVDWNLWILTKFISGMGNEWIDNRWVCLSAVHIAIGYLDLNGPMRYDKKKFCITPSQNNDVTQVMSVVEANGLMHHSLIKTDRLKRQRHTTLFGTCMLLCEPVEIKLQSHNNSWNISEQNVFNQTTGGHKYERKTVLYQCTRCQTITDEKQKKQNEIYSTSTPTVYNVWNRV